MPISLEEVKNLPKARPKTGIVDWESVIDQIVQSGEYFSAKEVTDKFVEGKVKIFRVKAVLDKSVEDGLLEKFWHEKKSFLVRLFSRRYVYGKPVK